MTTHTTYKNGEKQRRGHKRITKAKHDRRVPSLVIYCYDSCSGTTVTGSLWRMCAPSRKSCTTEKIRTPQRPTKARQWNSINPHSHQLAGPLQNTQLHERHDVMLAHGHRIIAGTTTSGRRVGWLCPLPRSSFCRRDVWSHGSSGSTSITRFQSKGNSVPSESVADRGRLKSLPWCHTGKGCRTGRTGLVPPVSGSWVLLTRVTTLV